MADAATGRRLPRRGTRARLVVLQPRLEGARDRSGRISRLGARQARREDRHDERLRQGRGDRRSADDAPRSARPRWVEPLQHGPGPQAGQLKDQGLRALLRRLADARPRADHSLIVLTSRLAVADIQRFKEAAPVVEVERLSDEAGAELLRDNDVWGIDKELRAACHDFGGHPLALTLLASFL